MMETRKSRYIVYIEFYQPQKPEHIENQLRYAISKDILPPMRELMVGIDHKNMRQSNGIGITVPLVVTENDEIKEPKPE